MTSVLMGTAVVAGSVAANEPSAIVEDIDAPGTKVQFMDYVEPGKVIRLGASGTVTLGYLASCLRESVTGGQVTIGRERSRIEGGRVKRERVECDGGRLNLSAEQAGKSAVLVLRKPPGSARSENVRPSVKIYGSSPVITLTDKTRTVVIERLDHPADTLEVAVTRGFVDLAEQKRSLKPGGIYRARAGERIVVFKVDPFAEPGPGPIIGRLIQF